MKIIFIYTHAVIGGAETLIYRIAQRALERGISTSFYCSSACDEIIDLFSKASIPIYEYGEILNPSICDIKDDDIVITMGSRQYLEALCYLSKKKIAAKLFLYIVHPDTVANWLNGKSLKRKKFFSPIIEQSITNNNFIFMDEQCWEETIRFYQYDFSEKQRVIKRLSITEKPEIKNDILIHKKQDFTILTVARADYPFKGYVKGLLSIFEELSDLYDLNMIILASGKSMGVLKEWISQNVYRNKIKLYENVNYYDIDAYYQQASLYVGMGTTVLEASSYSVPSIAVEYDTYECRAKGIFFEDPTHVAIDKGIGESCLPLIKTIIDTSDSDYIDIACKSREVIKKNYNADEFIDYVLNTDVNIIKVPLKLAAYMIFRKMRLNIQKRSIRIKH